MAHEDLHHASPDDEYVETPPDAEYEHTDANVWVIVKFLFWLAISAVLIHVGLGLMYQLLIQRSIEVDQPYPLAAGQEGPLPPAPRLQQFPQSELYRFRLEEQALLERYGWMNKEAGLVHIPIEEAMRLTLERGVLQSRAQETGQRGAPDARPLRVGVEPAGLMPSDASAGRQMERRRQ